MFSLFWGRTDTDRHRQLFIIQWQILICTPAACLQSLHWAWPPRTELIGPEIPEIYSACWDWNHLNLIWVNKLKTTGNKPFLLGFAGAAGAEVSPWVRQTFIFLILIRLESVNCWSDVKSTECRTAPLTSHLTAPSLFTWGEYKHWTKSYTGEHTPQVTSASTVESHHKSFVKPFKCTSLFCGDIVDNNEEMQVEERTWEMCVGMQKGEFLVFIEVKKFNWGPRLHT